MKSKISLCISAILLAGASLSPALAAEPPAKYFAPTGFGGKLWGTPLSSFPNFRGEPSSVGAAWTKGKTTDVSFNCVSSMPMTASAGDAMAGGGMSNVNSNPNCDMTSSRARERNEGGGFHVMMEHRTEKQGFRFGENGVPLYPVVYQFCAAWDSVKKEMPADLKERANFCGMRMMFTGETDEELAKMPADADSRYDRVLDALIAQYGRPFRFEKKGRVVIELEDGTRFVDGQRAYKTLRWCPPADRALATSCEASVVLSYDAQTRVGAVMYSTPQVWAYAHARESSDFKGEDLYQVLHARERKRKAAPEVLLSTN